VTRTLLINAIGLIGDHVMTMPAVVEYLKCARERGEPVDYWPHQDAEGVWAMTPPEYGITEMREPVDRSVYDRVIELDLHGTAGRSSEAGWYGTQGFFGDLGMPVPSVAPRPQLAFHLDGTGARHRIFDYGLAPFARSLRDHERWPRERWQALVDAMPAATFALYGAGGIDDPQYVTGPNVTPVVGDPLRDVTDSIARLRCGLISVSTGLAHLAFAAGTPLFLLSNQGTFSSPPTAIRIAGGTVQPDKIPLDTVRTALAERAA